MQLPEIVQWLDLGGHTAVLVLGAVVYTQLRDLRQEFHERTSRLEGLLMRSPDNDSQPGADS